MFPASSDGKTSTFARPATALSGALRRATSGRSEEHTSELQSRQYLVCRLLLEKKKDQLHSTRDLAYLRSPTRGYRNITLLNSSHANISYSFFYLKNPSIQTSTTKHETLQSTHQ